MNTKKILGPLVVSILLAVGCGDDGGPTSATTTTSIPSQAAITVTVSPQPATAEPNPEPDFPWLVRFSVTIRETAGLGVNVDFVNLSAPGKITLNFGANDIIDAAGSNHIDALGSLEMKMEITYGNSREINGNVLVQPLTIEEIAD